MKPYCVFDLQKQIFDTVKEAVQIICNKFQAQDFYMYAPF